MPQREGYPRSGSNTETVAVSEGENGPRNTALDWALNILGDRWTLLVLYEISAGTAGSTTYSSTPACRGIGWRCDFAVWRLRQSSVGGGTAIIRRASSTA